MYWQQYFNIQNLTEGDTVRIGSHEYILIRNILRQKAHYSDGQSQTKDTFAFKWSQRSTYESRAVLENHKIWLMQRYLDGDPNLLEAWISDGLKVLDAGCGSGYSALLLFENYFNRIHYLGVDISSAVDVAAQRFMEAGQKGEFMQADLTDLPFPGPTFDMIFSEGVLHHTDSPKKSLEYLVGLLVPGGRFLFYVYRKKGAIREFTDDYIRNYLRDMDDKVAWDALVPLTRLGKALGDLNVKVQVPEDIPYLNISAGEIDIQRLFYWHIFKAFYKRDWNIDELNHINFDWYRPHNCHRHTLEEIKEWCRSSRLEVEHLNEQESGFTVVAKKEQFRN